MDWIDEVGKISETREGSSSNVITRINVFPSSYEEVSEIIKFAIKNNLKIYPFGKNSNHIGPNVNADIGLSTEKLNRIIDISEEDLYVTAQAGVDFQYLSNVLKSHGLQIPFLYSGTTGGFASTNLPSILTWYGYPKDWLLGAKIATGLGEIIKSGSKTTKFSSGYKIWKALSGALGWLGIYLEINIRLIPYQNFHFEEIKNYEEYFKRRPLGIISVKEGNNIKIYAVIRGEGKIFEIPKKYDASIVTVRGKEIDVLKEIEGDYCVAYYGNGLIRCNGIDVEGLRSQFVVIKERNCASNCFGYNYEAISMLKNSLDPNGIFFNIFQ